MISLHQIKHIASTDPRLYEVLVTLINNHNKLANYHGIDTSGIVAAPISAGGSLTIVAANGVFRATINDKSAVGKGINYFLEHDTDPNFGKAVPVFLGPSRSWEGFLGSGTFYFRWYSQYPLSPASPWVYGPKAGINGGGAIAGPAPLPGQGSGTNPTLPGTGFGINSRQRPTYPVKLT